MQGLTGTTDSLHWCHNHGHRMKKEGLSFLHPTLVGRPRRWRKDGGRAGTRIGKGEVKGDTMKFRGQAKIKGRGGSPGRLPQGKKTTAGDDKRTRERKTRPAESQDQPAVLGGTMADSSKIELMSFRKWGRASEEAATRGCGGGRGAMAAEGRGPQQPPSAGSPRGRGGR